MQPGSQRRGDIGAEGARRVTLWPGFSRFMDSLATAAGTRGKDCRWRTRLETYTHGHHESVVSPAPQAHRRPRRRRSSCRHLRPGMRLLDVGCGPGSITRRAADGRRARAVCSASTCRSTTLPAGARASPPSAGTTNCDVRATPTSTGLDRAPTARSTSVYAHQVLQHVARPVAALRRDAAPARARRHRRRARQRLRHLHLEPGSDPHLARWLEIYHAVARAATAPRPTPGASCTAGCATPASTDGADERHDLDLPRLRRGRDLGERRGPSARRARTSRRRRSSTASRRATELEADRRRVPRTGPASPPRSSRSATSRCWRVRNGRIDEET